MGKHCVALSLVILVAVMNPVSTCRAQAPCPCGEPAPTGAWACFRERLHNLFSRSKNCDGCDAQAKVPPAPRRICCPDEEGGMLLKTGAFQLGPGVGRDLLNSQSDGKWGFWD